MDSPNAASVDAKFGVPGTPGTPGTPKEKEKKFEKPKVTRNAPPVTFILVTVNDRLGTKAQVPCLASDTVRDFKLLVAAKIGRQPHEIMIKRQGQRPFKDNLTLDDYEVSNGVQLDLELSTGD
ncbi:ubiquitin-like protein [Eremomyces bilateralis CBS 781.70]|uniref:Ubiquitin-like modifier HUB1 n=1 Tax=Eremomyces bilateralis CBS 781.70 TaxID=1392243 RepID=A0A6G1G5Y7_9PEZI|nr:ubiquitin-like protein [Eremomyces bilateralis CBS 781.70]KAF1813432.1 ubiquitin-like protein [Eremomyces bilateralis CBS 781.70]